MDDGTWTPEIVKRLIIIKEQAWSYTWIHRENSIYLLDIYDWVSIIAYSLTFFNGIVLIFPTRLIYIRIFNILLSFGSGILMFYLKNKQLAETSEKHKVASSKFSSIYNNIDRQLSVEPHRREPAHHYHKWITSQYDSLYGSAPDIDSAIIDRYVSKFAHKRKINPIEAAEFDKDSTTTEESTKKNDDTSSSYVGSSSSSSSDLEEVVIVKPPSDDNLSEKSDEENHKSSDRKSSLSGIIENLNQGEAISDADQKILNEMARDPENPHVIRVKSARRKSTLPEIIENINHGEGISESDKKILNQMAHDPNNPFVIKIKSEKKNNKHKGKMLKYELNRYNRGQLDFQSQNDIGMTTKCFIPEYELEEKKLVSKKSLRK